MLTSAYQAVSVLFGYLVGMVHWILSVLPLKPAFLVPQTYIKDIIATCSLWMFAQPLTYKTYHECEIFARNQESQSDWIECEKNRGHRKFIPMKYFRDSCMPRLSCFQKLMVVGAMIDLTVRLRVRWTSRDRPDNDDLAVHRGTAMLRTGTGFILEVIPVSDKPCPCSMCRGGVSRAHWIVKVQTACHVVWDNSEVKFTKVDVFYDEPDSDLDGTMKSMGGLEMDVVSATRDFCQFTCVTHDQELGLWIQEVAPIFHKSDLTLQVFSELKLLPEFGENYNGALIISHPHGQAKQITGGEMVYKDKLVPLLKYNTPTCPGSSGAPVFALHLDATKFPFLWFGVLVHGGSFVKPATQHATKRRLHRLKRWFSKLLRRQKPTQLNYGFNGFLHNKSRKM